MKYLLEYWSQIAVLLGLIGYLLKVILDYRIKEKELRNKYFYELKAKKIVELHSKIVEIQMMVDRGKETDEFGTTVFKKRIDLDRFFWESTLYFSPQTQKVFTLFLENLKFFESNEFRKNFPDIEEYFEKINQLLVKEFRNELL